MFDNNNIWSFIVDAAENIIFTRRIFYVVAEHRIVYSSPMDTTRIFSTTPKYLSRILKYFT